MVLCVLFYIGFCGIFNDNKDDDLIMFNGIVFMEIIKEVN